MARIKIEDLPVDATSPDNSLTDDDLDAVVGGALTLASTTSYFISKPQSYSLVGVSPSLPLPGGSLVSMPALSGVRG